MKEILRVIVCLVLGHKDTPISLTLGKITPEAVQTSQCARCGRISVLTIQFRAKTN
jgi:hypothetical protein